MSWEQLRKEARRLESEVEGKLVEYAKLGDSYVQSSHLADRSASAADFDEENVDPLFSTLALEIEQNIKRVGSLQIRLSKYDCGPFSLSLTLLICSVKRNQF
jgi:hypothetical protein